MVSLLLEIIPLCSEFFSYNILFFIWDVVYFLISGGLQVHPINYPPPLPIPPPPEIPSGVVLFIFIPLLIDGLLWMLGVVEYDSGMPTEEEVAEMKRRRGDDVIMDLEKVDENQNEKQDVGKRDVVELSGESEQNEMDIDVRNSSEECVLLEIEYDPCTELFQRLEAGTISPEEFFTLLSSCVSVLS